MQTSQLPMRMCWVDIKERACTGKAGGVEMGPAADAHAHCRLAAGGGCAGKRGGVLGAAALAHLPGEEEGAAAKN